MRRYFFNGGVFLAVGVLLFLPLCLLFRWGYAASLNDRVFSLPRSTTVLVAGDSHAEVTVDPGVWRGAENIGSSAENYLFTYYKLRHFLQRNPQITTVVLSCSWHNFSPKYQDEILFGAKQNQLDRYYPLLDAEGVALFRSLRPGFLVPFFRYSLGLPLEGYLDQVAVRKALGKNLKKEHLSCYGGYKKSVTAAATAGNIAKKLGAYFPEASAGDAAINPFSKRYLFRIAELCRSRHVQLVLLNAPVHPRYAAGIPPRYRVAFDRVQAELKERFPETRSVDYSRFPLSATQYYDADHVNTFGAAPVTRSLAALLAAP